MKRRRVIQRVLVFLLLLGGGAMVTIVPSLFYAWSASVTEFKMAIATESERLAWRRHQCTFDFDDERIRVVAYTHQDWSGVTRTTVCAGMANPSIVNLGTEALIESGWPRRSLRGRVICLLQFGHTCTCDGAMEVSREANESRFLPTRPIWPGFAINTVFYAGALWMLFAAPFAWRRRFREGGSPLARLVREVRV